ncbi:MAG: PEP-CTERM sorting domain-containing protein [Geminicoccaceae bacterium]
MKTIIAGAIGLFVATQMSIAHAIIIDFEDVPPLATGPSLFADAGPAQDITVAGVTFSGGVVLGFPTNFPASPFSTPPNVYASASSIVAADPSLLPAISIALDPSVGATEVEGLLFNGLTVDDSFLVEAFSSSTVVASQSLVDLPPNFQNGFGVFRLASGGPVIDLVTITADLSGLLPDEWDFVIDTVAINEPIENVLVAVTEPSTIGLLALAMAGIGMARRRRRSV